MRATRGHAPHARVSEHGAGSQLRALADLRLRVSAGLPVAASPDTRIGRSLALCHQTGAPVLPSMDATAAALKHDVELARAIRVQSAQGRAVLSAMIMLPLGLVFILSMFSDVDMVGFYTSSFGMAIGAFALTLQVIAFVWARKLISRVERITQSQPGERLPLPLIVGVAAGGWFLLGTWGAALGAVIASSWRRKAEMATALDDEAVELVASGLAGGLTHAACLRAVATQRADLATALHGTALRLELGQLRADDPANDRLRQALALAHDTGAPVGGVLRHVAQDLRAERLARAMESANRLPSQLIYPVAACLLPATLLLAVAPVVTEGLSGFSQLGIA